MTITIQIDAYTHPDELKVVEMMARDMRSIAEARYNSDLQAKIGALTPLGQDEPELPFSAPVAVTETPKRERGKPSPGKSRRTKEEVAEDEVADAAEQEVVANISTGEERIDPTSPEDAAQDAEDEATEAEAVATPEATADDVRAALGKYVKAYGMPAAMEDGPKVLALLFGDKCAKISDIPADAASYAKAVAGIDEMLVKNPYKREADL
jgi:hypothetical protein